MGLGLPLPAAGKKSVWGYEKKGEVYYPITHELDALYTACQMSESRDYDVPDILEWLHTATGHGPSRRNFFYFKEKRPLFTEYKTLTVDQRIELFNNVRSAPSPAAKEEAEAYQQSSSYEQAGAW